MKELENREDIKLLIDTFYKKILIDDKIGFFFTKVIKLDWSKHIPIMYDFWETTLLGVAKYNGNPMLKHIELNAMEAIKAEHFERWISIWKETIQENFVGEISEQAIKKAEQIGGLMKFKIEQHTTKPKPH
jgi:hemoglobin